VSHQANNKKVTKKQKADLQEHLTDQSNLPNKGKKTKKISGKRFWSWLTATKERIYSLLFLILFVLLMIILGIFSRDPTIIMLKIVYWFNDHTGAIGLYLGVAVISIFGNFLVFIPSMYAIVLMFVAATGLVNVWLLGIAAGLGASVGQIGSWFLGRATREMIDERSLKRLRKVQRWIERGLAPFLIYFFAATPLPDEVLLITIGLVNYSLVKTLFYCFLGKITLTVGVSILANLLSTTAFGKWMLAALFNLTPEMLANAQLPPNSNVWTSIAVWLISALLIVLGGFIDWVELLDKRKSKIDKRALNLLLKIAKKCPEEDISSPFITITYYKKEQKEFFPEDAFWFFEEKLAKKRDVYLRKSLMDISAIVNSDIEITLSNEWLKRVRENYHKQLLQPKEQEITLIKYPFRRLASGVLLRNLRLLSFKVHLRNILREKSMDYLAIAPLPKRVRKRLLQRKLTFNLLFETRETEPSKVIALGLTEGIYLRSMEEITTLEALQYCLNLVEVLAVAPETVTNYMIYRVKYSTAIDDKFILPKEFDESYPI